jgi:hypothetical protein
MLRAAMMYGGKPCASSWSCFTSLGFDLCGRCRRRRGLGRGRKLVVAIVVVVVVVVVAVVTCSVVRAASRSLTSIRILKRMTSGVLALLLFACLVVHIVYLIVGVQSRTVSIVVVVLIVVGAGRS